MVSGSIARTSPASDGADYREVVGFARHRVGLTDWLTAGVRAEGTKSVLSGGPELAVRLPLGEARLDAAASVDDGRAGWAAATAYTWQGPLLSLGTSLRLLSSRYATSSQRAADDRAHLETGAFIGLPLGPRIGMTLAYARSDFRSGPRQERISLVENVRLLAATEPGGGGNVRIDRWSPGRFEPLGGVHDAHVFSR
jgi:outer membrane usher protein